MNVGSMSAASSPFQGFAANNDRHSDRPSAVVEGKSEAEPSRRDDEKSRPAVIDVQASNAGAKRTEPKGDHKDRGAKVDFSV